MIRDRLRVLTNVRRSRVVFMALVLTLLHVSRVGMAQTTTPTTADKITEDMDASTSSASMFDVEAAAQCKASFQAAIASTDTPCNVLRTYYSCIEDLVPSPEDMDAASDSDKSQISNYRDQVRQAQTQLRLSGTVCFLSDSSNRPRIYTEGGRLVLHSEDDIVFESPPGTSTHAGLVAFIDKMENESFYGELFRMQMQAAIQANQQLLEQVTQDGGLIDQKVASLESSINQRLDDLKNGDVRKNKDDIADIKQLVGDKAVPPQLAQFKSDLSDLTDLLSEYKEDHDDLVALVGEALTCIAAGKAYDAKKPEAERCRAALWKVEEHDLVNQACKQEETGTLMYSGNFATLFVCNGRRWEPAFQGPVGSFSNPASSCTDVYQDQGPNSGWYYLKFDGTVDQVYCDLETQAEAGGWILITANGNLESKTCSPMVNPAAKGCGNVHNALLDDYRINGDYLAHIDFNELMVVLYDDDGYISGKQAYFAISWDTVVPVTQERQDGHPLEIPDFKDLDLVGCTEEGYPIPPHSYMLKTSCTSDQTVTKFDTHYNSFDAPQGVMAFYDQECGSDHSCTGWDDYQDGCGCSNNWSPRSQLGARAALFVRKADTAIYCRDLIPGSRRECPHKTATSCQDLSRDLESGVRWIGDPAYPIFCITNIDNAYGQWTAVAANGDLTDSSCKPALTSILDGCGHPEFMMPKLTHVDFRMPGDMQAKIKYDEVMVITYDSDGVMDGRTAYFAIQWDTPKFIEDESEMGQPVSYDDDVDAQYGYIRCDDKPKWFTRFSSCNNPDPDMTKFGTVNKPSPGGKTDRLLSFQDESDGCAQSDRNCAGFDDYQDGCGCTHNWAPKQVLGQRAVLLVRQRDLDHACQSGAVKPGTEAFCPVDVKACHELDVNKYPSGFYHFGTPGNTWLVYCNSNIDPLKGAWTLLTVNGQLNHPKSCEPAISDQMGGCGQLVPGLQNDYRMDGARQAEIVWDQMLFVTFSSGFTTNQNSAFMAVEWDVARATTEARTNGQPLNGLPGLASTAEIRCGSRRAHGYIRGPVRSGCRNPDPDMTKILVKNNYRVPESSDASATMGFYEDRTLCSQSSHSCTGFDDYQDGCGCSNNWGPRSVLGQRAALLVRQKQP